MYSLGADVFINAFNQRLSMWTLSGLYIPSMCDNGQDFKGEPAFVDLYRRFNIRNAAAPLDLAFNGIVLVGFFVEMKIQDYTQGGIDGFSWETPFLGRMNNLLEDPDPIVVADAPAFGPDAPDPVRNGELADNRQGTYFGDNPDMLTYIGGRPYTDQMRYLDRKKGKVDSIGPPVELAYAKLTEALDAQDAKDDRDYWEKWEEEKEQRKQDRKNKNEEALATAARQQAKRESDAAELNRLETEGPIYGSLPDVMPSGASSQHHPDVPYDAAAYYRTTATRLPWGNLP
jgi:hypothetical protein